MNSQTIMDFDHLPKELKESGFFVGQHIDPDYERIKGMLSVRPYPLDTPGVREAIHMTVGDIALVLYAVLYEDDGVTSGMKVPAFMEQVWGMPKEHLMENALKKEQPRILDFMRVIMDPDGCPLDGIEDFSSLVTPCLTTERKLNGAVASFIPGVAKRIGDLIGEDYYMVFSSVHEVMLHPVTEADPEFLQAVLADTIKNATSPCDVLTYRIYRYHREEDEIRIV